MDDSDTTDSEAPINKAKGSIPSRALALMLDDDSDDSSYILDRPIPDWADLSDTSDSEVERPPNRGLVALPSRRGQAGRPLDGGPMLRPQDGGTAPWAEPECSNSRYCLGGELPLAEGSFYHDAVAQQMLQQQWWQQLQPRQMQQVLPGTYGVPPQTPAGPPQKPQGTPKQPLQDVSEPRTIHDVFQKLNDVDIYLHSRTLTTARGAPAEQFDIQQNLLAAPPPINDPAPSPFATAPAVGNRTQNPFAMPPKACDSMRFPFVMRPQAVNTQSRRRMFGSLPRQKRTFEAPKVSFTDF